MERRLPTLGALARPDLRPSERALGPRFLGLVALAAVGGALLLIVALARWGEPSDEHAYWLAGWHLLNGQAVYEPGAGAATPYAFWYPPIVAQLMAPIAAVLPSPVFSAAWTVLLLGCLWWLGGRRPLVALALVAFVPVAVELWFRNVQLVLAVLVVLGLRRWPWAFAVGAATKIAPGLGIVYLAARGRWRDAALATAIGVGLLAVSFALSPGLWTTYGQVLAGRGPADAASLLPVPYALRAIVALVLAIVAGRLPRRWGEILLVVAVVVGSPTLWTTTLSMLIAIVPLLRTPPAVGRPLSNQMAA